MYVTILILCVIFSNFITDLIYRVLSFITSKTKTQKDDKALAIATKVVTKLKSKKLKTKK